MFRGSIVAIVTPFKGGAVDEKCMAELIEFHISSGTNGIVPCGTTGESATLTHEEHERVIEFVVEVCNKRIPVIAGAGSNSTEEALRLTRAAKRAGADGALLITPYYNKPTQKGLLSHYEKIATEVDIPIIIYNVPGRTGVSIQPETVERLSRIDNIVGIKEASGNLDQVSKIINLCGDRITVLSGDDSLTLPILSIGGKGVISATANIVPGDFVALIDAFERGDIEEARRIHNKLFPICKAMFIETNPIPVKTALALMGKIHLEFRLPLSEMKEETLEHLKKVIKEYGLIS
jgi:4-hydroxy-tetrahydrodipicolinate synthase